jgi:site-specific recombinase XerD
MDKQLQPVSTNEVLDSLGRTAREFASRSRASNTIRAYDADWRDFSCWCVRHSLQTCPADTATVALYLTQLSRDHKVATLTRRLSAISQIHQVQGYPSPAAEPRVRLVMAGIRRTLGSAPAAKRPVLVPDLQAITASLPASPLGLRDRALLLIGFAAALRRGELVALNHEDIQRTPDGLILTIRRGKTDQEAAGRRIAIPRGREEATCPVRALTAWLDAAAIDAGPVFRRVNRHHQILPQRLSPEGVAIVVKRCATRLGYDAAEFGGHSLRAGLATSAAIAGKSERSIMNQTGHRSLSMVRRYIREGNLFRENAADGLL